MTLGNVFLVPQALQSESFLLLFCCVFFAVFDWHIPCHPPPPNLFFFILSSMDLADQLIFTQEKGIWCGIYAIRSLCYMHSLFKE